MHFGGPDGELGASLRYLSQRYSMPYPRVQGLLTDIGTEELGHLEMIAAIVHQLTRNLTDDQIREALEVSAMTDFLPALPQGLDTVLGESGAGLSEGQAQRLAIARAILSGAPVC